MTPSSGVAPHRGFGLSSLHLSGRPGLPWSPPTNTNPAPTMRISTRLAVIFTVLGLGLFSGASSRLDAQSLYLGGGWVYGVSDFGDTYENGANFSAGFKYGLPLLDFRVGGGWTWFNAPSGGVGGSVADDVSAFDIHAGAMFNLAMIGLGARAGYWFNDLDEFDILPMGEVRIWKLFAGAEYKGLFGDADWVGVFLGVRF